VQTRLYVGIVEKSRLFGGKKDYFGKVLGIIDFWTFFNIALLKHVKYNLIISNIT
jgi:hypothetical protein